MARGSRAAAAEVLRHLTHPARLRTNSAVRDYFSASSAEGDAQAIDRIKTVVDGAVARLPQLQRTIVRRCDLAGEMHRDVAADLALSVRHFYRLRARAIAAVDRALADGLRIAQTSAPRLDPLDVLLSHAEAFEQAGSPEEAIARLARGAAGADVSAARVTLECRIANVYANSGDIERASTRVAAAAAAAAVLAPELRSTATLEVKVTQAFVDAASGDSLKVLADSSHLVTELRRLVAQGSGPRLVEALVVVLTLQAERSRDVGLLSVAIAATDEAGEVLQRSDATRPILRLLSRHQALAALCLVPSAQQAALHDLASLSIEAARSGFVRESALIAGGVASLYRALGVPRMVLEVALPVLAAVRETCGRSNAAIILSDVAAAYSALQQYDAALELLNEVDQLATTCYARAIINLRRAELAHGRRNFDDAADSALTARDAFLTIGNSRLAATSMCVLAEAFEAQGRGRKAAETIAESLELQGGSAFTYARVRTLRTAARIMHDRRYLTEAREIARS
jgi:tetratricopeptide (TPR) repeat protein